MPNVMPYEQQEEFCYNILRVAPVVVSAAAMTALFSALGYTLTLSNFSRAKERVKGLPSAPPKGPKERYLVALASAYPGLTPGQGRLKAQDWFGEDTRPDVALKWFEHARACPMEKVEADRIIAEVESGRNLRQQPAFDLTEER